MGEHEPECECGTNAHTSETCEMCSCPELRAAMKRAALVSHVAALEWAEDKRVADVEAAYLRGYNDHARTLQHWQDTHGAYRPTRANEERRQSLERGEMA